MDDPEGRDHAAALDLVEACWTALDKGDLPRARRWRIWDEFLGRVRSAARAPDLRGFVERLARTWVGGPAPRDAVGVLGTLTEEDAALVLARLRREAAVLATEVRARREVRGREDREVGG